MNAYDLASTGTGEDNLSYVVKVFNNSSQLKGNAAGTVSPAGEWGITVDKPEANWQLEHHTIKIYHGDDEKDANGFDFVE